MAKKKAPKKKRSKLRIVVYLIATVGLTLVMSFAILLFMLGMLPAFVANYVDGSNERNHFRIVSACNLAGVLPFLIDLWKKGITSNSVQDMLVDPHVWLVMYGAAAFGWMLVWLFPLTVHFVLNVAQSSAISSLQHKQQQIVDEWGLEVEASARRALRNATFGDDMKANKEESGEQLKLAAPKK